MESFAVSSCSPGDPASVCGARFGTNGDACLRPTRATLSTVFSEESGPSLAPRAESCVRISGVNRTDYDNQEVVCQFCSACGRRPFRYLRLPSVF